MTDIPKNAANVYGQPQGDGNVVVDRTKPFNGTCTDCGEKTELRPYGQGGAWVCFPCAMKDEPNARKMATQVLFGGGVN